MLATAIAAVVAEIVVGPSAAADPDAPDPGTYLFMLREANVTTQSDNDAIGLGLMVCQHVRTGESAGNIVTELRNYPSNALTQTAAAEVVVTATEQLCPETSSSIWRDAMILAGRNPYPPASPSHVVLPPGYRDGD
jgi:hypothetical protein